MKEHIVNIGASLDSRIESDEYFQKSVTSVSSHIKDAINCLEQADITDLKQGKKDCLVLCLSVESMAQVELYERIIGYILENQDGGGDEYEYVYTNRMHYFLFLLIRKKQPKQPVSSSKARPRERPCDVPGGVKGEENKLVTNKKKRSAIPGGAKTRGGGVDGAQGDEFWE